MADHIHQCPSCDTLIGESGISSSSLGGPFAQHTKCPTCGRRLVRNPESPLPEMTEWRINKDIESADL